MKAAKDVNEYIAGYPKVVQKLLEQMRTTIKRAAPDAKEIISYGMPAYKQNRVLVYFGGHTSHIGFYPTSSGIREFEKEFSGYKYSKGAVQFPIDEPLPLELVTKIVEFRLKEDLLKAKSKAK